ncbi:MAG: hypothetical protein WAS02_00630, partial [Propionicimonas sp.]
MPSFVTGFRLRLASRRESATATQMVERAILLLFSILRLGVTLQVGVAFWFLIREPGVPGLILLITPLTVGYSVWLVVAVNHRG